MRRAVRGVVGARGRAATDDALRAALEAALARYFGRPYPIARLERRVSDYSTSFTIEELEVYGADAPGSDGRAGGAGPLRVVFKDLSRRALLPSARGVRPRFLYEPRREIGVYQRLLPGLGLGTADCYGAVADDAAGAYWLFLEHVAGEQLCHVGDFGHWQLAARRLARLHAALVPLAQNPPADLRLLSYDAAWYRRWLGRARRRLVAAAEAGPGPKHAARRIASLTANYGRVIDRLLSLPRTIIHGEFYAANVLIQGAGGDAVRVCPIDWETAAVGPGLMDLAALSAGDWSDAPRRGLADAWRQGWVDLGAAAPELEDVLEALEWCRLHQAIQWVGWAARWSPPPDQARDWSGDVLRLAERLGL